MGILDAILGGDDSLDGANKQIKKNYDLFNSILLPEFDKEIPEQLQAQLIEEDPQLKSRQMSLINKMAQLSDTGMSPEDELGYLHARDEGNQIAQGASKAAINDAQNRGVAGSGMEFAMREIGNQQGAQRAQQGAMQQAADAAKQRAIYNQAYGQQLGGERDQDYRASSNNAGILNQFNQLNSQNRQDALHYNNSTNQQQFGNEMQKKGAMAGVNNQLAQNSMAQGAANAQRNNALLNAGVGVATGGFFKKSPGDNQDDLYKNYSNLA